MKNVFFDFIKEGDLMPDETDDYVDDIVVHKNFDEFKCIHKRMRLLLLCNRKHWFGKIFPQEATRSTSWPNLTEKSSGL